MRYRVKGDNNFGKFVEAVEVEMVEFPGLERLEFFSCWCFDMLAFGVVDAYTGVVITEGPTRAIAIERARKLLCEVGTGELLRLVQ